VKKEARMRSRYSLTLPVQPTTITTVKNSSSKRCSQKAMKGRISWTTVATIRRKVLTKKVTRKVPLL